MLLLSSRGQLLAEKPCMPPTCWPQTAWVKLQQSPNTVYHVELRFEAISSPKRDFHPFKNFFCLPRRSLMTTEDHSGAKLSSHLETESKPECNIHHWAEVRGGGGEIGQPVLIWLSCVSLRQKQTPCWNFPTQTVFYFLQKVPNGREIFRTLISSAGKSYDEGQKYRKPLQTDCTPATSKGQKGKSLNVYHTAKLGPHVAGVFFSLRSGPSENSYFYKHANFFFFFTFWRHVGSY